MNQSRAANGTPPFSIAADGPQRSPIVLSIPHSGRDYPDAFLGVSRLDRQAIRGSEDVLVDELFTPATEMGVPALVAHFPRAWLDVNREPYELDPAMFAGALPSNANIRSVRVAGGLGTIPRIVAAGQEIYHTPLTVSEALDRIETVYKPYHQALEALMADSASVFGEAILVDCHSMPSSAPQGLRGRPDIVLGDRYGTSCQSDLTDFCAAVLGRLGYRVSRNRPYAGGFITEHHGHPEVDRHALQIEINRGLYVNEQTLEPNEGFRHLQRDLCRLVAELSDAVSGGLLAARQAAE